MAANLQLAINILLENGQFKSEILRSNQLVEQFGAGGARAGLALGGGMSLAKQGVVSISQQLANMQRIAGAAFAALQLSSGVGGIIRLADEYQNLNARLRNAARTTQEYAAAQRETYDLAQRTQTPLGALVAAYTRVDAAVRQFGGSQQESFATTERLIQAAKVYATSNAASAEVLQLLSKAFSDGTVKGMEFQRLIQNAPGLLQALADGLGVSTTELRRMADEGQLSAQLLSRALAGAADNIGKRAAALPNTVADAMTRVQNALLVYVGQQDAAGGATRNLADVLNGLADRFSAVADIVIRTGAVLAAVLGAQLASTVAASVAAFLQHRAALVAVNTALAATAVAELRVAAATVVYTQELVIRANAAMAAATGMQRLVVAETLLVPATQAAAAAQAAHTAVLARMNVGLIATARSMITLNNVLGVAVAAYAGWQLGSWLFEQFAIVRQAGYRIIQVFLEIREAGQLAADVLAAPFNADTVDAAVARYEQRIKEMRANIQGLSDAAAAPPTLADEAAPLAGRKKPAATVSLSEKELKAIEDLAKAEAERRENADETIRSAEVRLGLMREEQSLGRQMTDSERDLYLLRTGAYDDLLPSEREQLRLVLETTAALERQAEVTVELTEKSLTFTDGLVQGLEDFLQYATDAYSQGLNLANTFFGSLEDTMVQALNTGKFAWKDFGNVVIEEINRIAVQALLAGLKRQLIGLAAGLFAPTAPSAGTGNVGETFPTAGADAGFAHTGGVIGSDSLPTRRLPAFVFAGAPRYHSGMLASWLGPKERPTILEDGESVLTPAQMRAVGGRRSGDEIKISYSIDASGGTQAAQIRDLMAGLRENNKQLKAQLEEARRRNH